MRFPPVDQIVPGFKLPPDYLDRQGYRLPTEAEWEHACRAGTLGRTHFGGDPELARHYAWGLKNSDNVSHPVGLLKPNDAGLFDLYGNVWEWTAYLLAHTLNRIPRSAASCVTRSASSRSTKRRRVCPRLRVQPDVHGRAAALHEWLVPGQTLADLGFAWSARCRRSHSGFHVAADFHAPPEEAGCRVFGPAIAVEVLDVPPGIRVEPPRFLVDDRTDPLCSVDGSLQPFTVRFARQDAAESVRRRRYGPKAPHSGAEVLCLGRGHCRRSRTSGRLVADWSPSRRCARERSVGLSFRWGDRGPHEKVPPDMFAATARRRSSCRKGTMSAAVRRRPCPAADRRREAAGQHRAADAPRRGIPSPRRRQASAGDRLPGAHRRCPAPLRAAEPRRVACRPTNR